MTSSLLAAITLLSSVELSCAQTAPTDNINTSKNMDKYLYFINYFLLIFLNIKQSHIKTQVKVVIR